MTKTLEKMVGQAVVDQTLRQDLVILQQQLQHKVTMVVIVQPYLILQAVAVEEREQ
tara:strand:+ start:174 stop:341 length:168 start_codon:yes stop_codon:yes gene_type:complete